MAKDEHIAPADKQDARVETEAGNINMLDDNVSDSPHFNSLHVDSQGSDADSTLGESVASSTASLRPSVYEFVKENGRTYHKYSRGGRYYLPNDRSEQDRLNMQHELFKLALDGRLNLAPVSNAQSALDIGTGTGIWAIEFATQNPTTDVIGTDLSPIQPDFVPLNCRFEVDDVEDEWAFTKKFGYIHGRALFSIFKDPLVVFKKVFEALAPGGYFEMQDIYFKPHSPDGTVKGTRWEGWSDLVVECAQKVGRNFRGPPHYAQWMREAGFENVVEKVIQIPINTWARGQKNKIMGAWFLDDVMEGIEAISPALLRRNGMSTEEIDTLIDDVRNEMKDKSIHVYYPFIVVYGRKPL